MAHQSPAPCSSALRLRLTGEKGSNLRWNNAVVPDQAFDLKEHDAVDNPCVTQSQWCRKRLAVECKK